MNRPVNRNELLTHINHVSFAVDEVKLYLDTHPCDREALSYFQEMSRQRNEALKEYASAYGPLTLPQIPQTVPAPSAGTGSTSHGHGRKEAADLCGIMKKDCNIR